MMVTIDDNGLREAEKILNGISTQGAGKAISRALNRSILAARTAGTKAVGQEYAIKASDIKANLTMKKASYTNLTASLSAKGPAVDIMNFKVKLGSPIFAQVKKNGGGGYLKDSFAVVQPSLRVLHRQGAARNPTSRSFGPSIAQMFGNEATIKAMTDRASEVLETRLQHEMGNIIGGIAK